MNTSARACRDITIVAVPPFLTRAVNPASRRRAVTRLRRELRRIHNRDYFAPPERDLARRAVEDLAAAHPAQVRA